MFGILIVTISCQTNPKQAKNTSDSTIAPAIETKESSPTQEVSSNTEISNLELELISLLPSYSGTEENLEKNKSFKEKLISVLENNPSSLNFPFDSLKKAYVSVLTSRDGNFRVYCWDSYTGGTMHFFDRIYQYKTAGKTKIWSPITEEGIPGALAKGIYSDTLDGKMYYLVKDMGILSTKDRTEVITIYTIDTSGNIVETKKFKTPKKELSSINISYDAFDSAENGIDYDNVSREVRIPLVNDRFQVTIKSIIYKADGKYWVYSGIR